MNKIITCLTLLIVSLTLNAQSVLFNKDWKFNLADTADAKNIKFDDSQWTTLNLPHDWAFENGYSEDGAQREMGGYAMGGIGWYRKNFNIDASQLKDKHIFIDFEAAYMNSEVWVNNQYLGKRPYGYISFSYEITKFLKEGNNVISVRIDNSLEPSARWYHGCGIYGNVWLRTEAPTYFQKDGTFIKTPEITAEKGLVDISTEIVSDEALKGATLQLIVTDIDGKELAKKEISKAKIAKGLQTINIATEVQEPKLWSPESPSLYFAKLNIIDKNGKVIDDQSIRFGFRTIEWVPATGFHLNGKQYKMQGVCEHWEGGPTGAIATEKLLRWKIQLLKDMGCNAIRTAHNPYLPMFYHLCDEMGMLVMDELFDGWRKKAPHDYGAQAFDQWWRQDLKDWVRRDRNHPSIFLYSVGNETHGDVAKELVAACHVEDPTRLVTSGTANNEDMDVDGWNGGSENLEFMEDYKALTRSFVGTENPHTWQVRGFYRSHTWYRNGYPNNKQKPELIPNLTEKEIFFYDWTKPENRRNKKQIFNSSYDNATKTITVRHSIELLRKYDWYSGSFRWTGFDYLGEAGYVHGGWPFRGFMSGALDFAGFEKDLYFLYQSEWTNKDMVHILPHWTHPIMKKGELIPVRVYTTGDEVELFINGRSLGKKQKGDKWNEMQCDWLVAWEEGIIEAVSYRDGKKIATATQKTSGSPTKMGFYKWEESQLKADSEDITILTVQQLDNNGTVYPYGENRIYAKINGGAKVLSFENGSPVDIECNYNAESKKCFFGLNRLFIQSTDDKAEKPVSIILGVISGDKKLMLSDKIAIDVQQLNLRGISKAPKFDIRYTTDGSNPTKDSAKYENPFAIKLGTTVKATVYVGDEEIFAMEEIFSQDDGLYWGSEADIMPKSIGEQAEFAQLTDATAVLGDGLNYMGKGYAKFDKAGGTMQWYQENDGGTYDTTITIRYAQQFADEKPRELKLFNNDKLVKTIKFVNTFSVSSHWQEIDVKITINPGANSIKLMSVTDQAPNIDQIDIKN